jgi:hypothetical protein
MTLASAIITRAFRETNLLPVGQSPTTNQQTEALELLNTILLSSVGFEIADGLSDINIGGTYDQSSLCSVFVPDNIRLVLNLSTPTTFNLDPMPREGQRLSFVDAKGNLAALGLTLNGNGRLIEGLTSIVLNVNSDSRQWIYRADTGNWVKINTLVLADSLPFPAEFDDYFVTTLAMRLNPRFAQAVTNETLEALKRSKNLINSRYMNIRQVRSDVESRDSRSNGRRSRYSDTDFNRGLSYPYL